MTPDELQRSGKALISVEDAHPGLFPLSERSLRRALEPGGDLEHLALRVGRRVFIKVAPTLELLALPADKDVARSAEDLATVTATDTEGPHDDCKPLRAV